ncbi:MAG: YcxB family protein [Planctomycetota bacterium]|nr:YcxB family protein [Planctomycetota bacterium]
MQADIQATYTISRAEYLQAMRRHYRRTSKYVQDIGPMMITSGVIMLESEKGRVLGWIQISLGLLLLLMLIYAVWLMPVLMYRNQPKLQSEYHLTFDKSVIRLQTDQIQSQLQWSFYQSWRLDDQYYYLYYGKQDLSVIPRRAFSAEADSQLAELLQQKIGPPVK